MSKLHLAETLSLPIDACTQTFAWIGRKGSGKTYGSGKMVEELLEAEIQTVILDTVGNWYGLRIKADGKGKGFDIPVFGGLRKDLPLLSTAGEVVADVVMDSRRSVILDVSQFNFSERKRFAADFGTRLWQRKKAEAEPSPLHLVIEECQLIVPQYVQKDDTRMVHVYEEIIRLGRNYGIGASMITQRPQSVNKEVLTQAECIMAFQINGVPERKALKEWLTYEGGDVNLVNELPRLPVGTCYLWSPQWLRKFEKVKIGKKSTLDASATPKAGQSVVRRDPAPLDVKDIESRMASTIEKAKAEDPKELRQTIAQLQKELNVAKALTPTKSDPTIKEVPVIHDKQIEALERVIERAGEVFPKFIEELEGKIRKPIDLIGPMMTLLGSKLDAMKQAKHRDVSRHVPTRPHTAPSVRIHAHDSKPAGDLSAGERRILTVLAQHPAGKPTVPLAHLAGYTVNGHFTNMLGALRSNGYVKTGQPVCITAEGLVALGPYDELPTGEALRSYWLGKVSSGEARILRVLIEHYPQGITSPELAAESGYTVNGHFTNMLGHLRTIQLAEGRGEIRASGTLFE